MLLFVPRGEVGDVAPEFLAGFHSIAELRESELRCAAGILGLAGVVFLDYRDSGMPGSADNEHPRAFVQAPLETVTGQLVALMRTLHPQVVVTFPPYGGSGGFNLYAQNVNLVGGQKYYLEARWREGTGGDGINVAVRSQGDTVVPGAGGQTGRARPGGQWQIRLVVDQDRPGPGRFQGLVGLRPGLAGIENQDHQVGSAVNQDQHKTSAEQALAGPNEFEERAPCAGQPKPSVLVCRVRS